MNLFRNFFFKLLYRLKIGHFLLALNRRKFQIPILVFHKIIPEYDAVWPGIHPKLFEKMIVLINQNYTVYPLHFLHTQPDMDYRGACFITFDDGYKDYLEYAFPILKKHKTHSTLFVLPYDLSNHGHIWTSTILYFVKHYPFEEVRDFFREHNQDIRFSNVSNPFRINLDITKHLCHLLHAERKIIIKALQIKFEKENHLLEKELLDYEELKKLDSQWVDFASHSLTHPIFENETDVAFIEHELKDSKNSIEKELGVKVSVFAFPFTKYNAKSLECVKKHYSLSFTGINDVVDLKKLKAEEDYHFNLSRFNIHHETAEEMFLLINGFHKFFKR